MHSFHVKIRTIIAKYYLKKEGSCFAGVSSKKM